MLRGVRVDINSAAIAVLTSSVTSTVVAVIVKALIEKRTSLQVDRALEDQRQAHALQLERLRVLHDTQTEATRLRFASVTAFENALVADRVELYRSCSTLIYRIKLLLACDGVHAQAALTQQVMELQDLLSQYRFYLQRDGVWTAVHPLKNRLLTHLALQQPTDMPQSSAFEKDDVRRASMLIESAEACLDRLSRVSTELSVYGTLG